MRPKKSPLEQSQGELFRTELELIINEDHELSRLAKVINWSELEEYFGNQFSEQGRPGKPTRLMVGLHYLKYAFDLSDQEVLSRWLENPYWQYFCGRRYFEKTLPVDSSSMTRWRAIRVSPRNLVFIVFVSNIKIHLIFVKWNIE